MTRYTSKRENLMKDTHLNGQNFIAVIYIDEPTDTLLSQVLIEPLKQKVIELSGLTYQLTYKRNQNLQNT
jgi:hypothetical protein